MKSEEQILQDHDLVNKGCVDGSLVNAISAMREFAKEECLNFGLHIENMSAINKITVHAPDGSGTGLYYKTIEQLYNEYKKVGK